MRYRLSDYDHKFKELLEEDYDLILVDIDGVIMTPSQYLCSSQWYVSYIPQAASYLHQIDYVVGSYLDNFEFYTSYIKPSNELATKITEDLYHCLTTTNFRPVDQNLIEALASLSTSTLVFGLTGRAYDFHNQTASWLNNFDMKFTSAHGDIRVGGYNSQLTSGIIYVGHDEKTALPHDKGKVLNLFIEKLGLNVQKVLFIDDFAKNLDHVQKFCDQNQIDFVGIEYVEYEEALKQSYTTEQLQSIGLAQFHHFFRNENHAILGDQEALNYCEQSDVSGHSYYNDTDWSW